MTKVSVLFFFLLYFEEKVNVLLLAFVILDNYCKPPITKRFA